MHFSVVVFGDNSYSRLLPFMERKGVKVYENDIALCVNKDHYYDSLTLLRQDFPDVCNEDVTLAKVQKQFSKCRIGGVYAGQLKVVDPTKGFTHRKNSRGGLDETTAGNLDLHNEKLFLPDYCLFRGKWVDILVGGDVDNKTKIITLAYDDDTWKTIVKSVPKDTPVTLVDCYMPD